VRTLQKGVYQRRLIPTLLSTGLSPFTLELTSCGADLLWQCASNASCGTQSEHAISCADVLFPLIVCVAYPRWPTSDQSDDHTGPELRNVPRGANILLNSMGTVSSNPDGGPNTQGSDFEVISKAVSWLQAKPVGSTPFFLYAGISIPHFPFVTNSTWLSKVNQSAITLPPWHNLGDMHPYDLHVSESM
jgi:hypothetical protein